MLNEKQKAFCEYYASSFNATESAKKAGYSEKTAYSQGQRMLKNVEVKSYIDEQMELIHSQKTADAQEVMEYLTAVMRGEHKEQVLFLVGDGMQSVRDIDVSAKERLKAAELLGRAHMMFTDKVQQEVDMDLNITVKRV